MSEVTKYTDAMIRGDDRACADIEQKHGVYGYPPEMVTMVLSCFDKFEAERAEQWRLRREAEADRDTAKAVAAELRAELAALKGGQVAVAWAVCREPGKVDALSATYASESAAKAHVNSYASKGYSGLHVTPLYTAPPAQASAWVPIALDALRAIEPFIPISTAKNGGAAAHIANVVAADKVRAALAAAPTPGASDGKGGDV